MAGNEYSTIQTNIKHYDDDNLLNYALFAGGVNVTHDVLAQYDPLRTGYGRLFMVRKPKWLLKTNPKAVARLKHILEYGNTAVQGIGDVEVQFNSITGGYAGKSFEIPSVAQDNTQAFTVTCYEFSGSPIRETLYTWINGTSDLLTGLCHYNGVKEDDVPRKQSNQTAEFIYVATDHTGQNVEYACLFANCFPSSVKNDHFNYTAGEHNLVEYQVEFRCTKYESIQINKVANQLLKRYRILANSLNFYSGIKSSGTDGTVAGTTSEDPDATNYNLDSVGTPKYYDYQTGTMKDGIASDRGTNPFDKPLEESELQML